MRKDFFLGLVSVYDWDWLWGNTAAQIELRTIDTPVVCYRRENKPKPGENGYEPDERKLNDAVRKFKEKQARRKYDMKHFLATGEKIERP